MRPSSPGDGYPGLRLYYRLSRGVRGNRSPAFTGLPLSRNQEGLPLSQNQEGLPLSQNQEGFAWARTNARLQPPP